MSEHPKISIVICTYNRAHLLPDTLDSLLNNTAPASLYEVLIIDNNSSDHTYAVVKGFIDKFPEHVIKYFKETRQGLSYARNRGIQEASFPLIAFFDDDIISEKKLISNWLNFFEKNPNVIGAGGKILVQFDAAEPGWVPGILYTLFGKHDHGKTIKKYRRGNYPFGGNMVFRARVFEKFGTFNTQLGRKGDELNGAEEKEFFYRISREEEDIFYVPDAILWHRVGPERLNESFIQKQAKGIGKSIAVMLENTSSWVKAHKYATELFKWTASIIMLFGYLITGNYKKGVTLLKFRYWILQGYLEHSRV